MADPTYGRIDADIQRAVDEMDPPGIGERVAWENTLQARRDAAGTGAAHDAVNHPQHYTSVVPGIECIDVTEHFPFCRGNAIKYLWRAGAKGDLVEDLRKAIWYIQREIDSVTAQAATSTTGRSDHD